MSAALLVLSAIALGGKKDPSCYAEVEQDLNCNGIDVRDEPAVDLTDPECAEQVDENGDPNPPKGVFKVGTVIGVLVDMDRGIVAFYKDKEDLGTACV